VAFNGYPKAAFDFYARLEADNTKAFWQANKSTFDDSVADRVRTTWAGATAMCDWLDRHVGPSTLPADARR